MADARGPNTKRRDQHKEDTLRLAGSSSSSQNRRMEEERQLEQQRAASLADRLLDQSRGELTRGADEHQQQHQHQQQQQQQKQRQAMRSRKSQAPMKRSADAQRVCHLTRPHLLMSCLLWLALMGISQWPLASVHCSSGAVGEKLRSSGSAAAGQLGDWLVREVAPAVASKIIDNVLTKPAGAKKAKALESDSSSSGAKAIDTHALADKIVDKLAESIKNKKSRQAGGPGASGASGTEERAAAHETSGGATSSRRGKSLVSDSVQHLRDQVMQNLFSKEPQRSFFGRAMEKHAKQHPLRAGAHSSHHNGAGSSWLMVKEPSYEPHLFVSTDSSQLDENPVVLRAEHGHNATSTTAPTTIAYSASYSDQQRQLIRQQQYNKLKQQQQQQHKFSAVHTNRHNQQQQLAPKPWQSGAGRRPQQSPYSLPVTSDINIVQAPSSPAPPTTSTSTLPTTTATASSSTTSLPQRHYESIYGQQHQITHMGANKFKINNRHQYPSSAVAIAPNSWYSSNHNARYPQHQGPAYNPQAHQHRFPMPSSSSTTSSTTTTTTTTTTPEPQTEPIMAEIVNNDLEPQTGSPVASILSSVAQGALEALGSSQGSQNGNQIDDSTYGASYHTSNSSAYYQPSAMSATSPANTKGSASTLSSAGTSARHSILTSEAIPTALGAPLYHLTRANFTTHSLMAPLPTPPRRVGMVNPATKALAQYVQKSMNSLSSTIFSRQSKSWARRLGLSSVLLSGLLYGAAVLSNPGAPLPANGLQVLQALSKGTKKRRGSSAAVIPFGEGLVSPAESLLASASQQSSGDIDRITNTAALLDSNVQQFYQQQPHLISIIEKLIQQEQKQLQQRQQQAQGSLFSQRAMNANPTLEIVNVRDADDEANRVESARRSSSNNVLPTSQQTTLFTLQALPAGHLYVPGLDLNSVDQMSGTSVGHASHQAQYYTGAEKSKQGITSQSAAPSIIPTNVIRRR